MYLKLHEETPDGAEVILPIYEINFSLLSQMTGFQFLSGYPSGPSSDIGFKQFETAQTNYKFVNFSVSNNDVKLGLPSDIPLKTETPAEGESEKILFTNPLKFIDDGYGSYYISQPLQSAVPVGTRPADWGTNYHYCWNMSAFNINNHSLVLRQAQDVSETWNNSYQYRNSIVENQPASKRQVRKLFFHDSDINFVVSHTVQYRNYWGNNSVRQYSAFGAAIGGGMGLNSINYALNDGTKILGLNDINGGSYYWAVPCIQYGDAWNTLEKMQSGFHGSFTVIHFIHEMREYIGFMYLRSDETETTPNYIYCTAFSREMITESVYEEEPPTPSWGDDTTPDGGNGTFSAPSDNRGSMTSADLIAQYTRTGGVIETFNSKVLANGVNIFKLSDGAMSTIQNILYNGNYFDKFKQSMYNPISAILSYHLLPASLTPLTLGGQTITAYVTASGYSFFSDVPSGMLPLSAQTKIDGLSITHIGSVDLSALFFGAFPDYAPFTKLYLHLPYIGVVNIDTNAVMGGFLAVDYITDIANGNVCAVITCSDRERPVPNCTYKYCATGNASYNIPMFAENQSGAAFGRIIGGVVSGVIGAATGNPIGLAGAAVSLATAAGVGVEHNTQVLGTIGGNAAMLTDTQCFLEIVRPVWVNPSTFAEINGISSGIGGTIAELNATGYLECVVHADGITATETECKEIEMLLSSGVHHIPNEN